MGEQEAVRLRQLVLVTRELEPALEQLITLFDLGAPYRDPGVAAFGLVNGVLVVGDCFLEIVAPVDPDCAATRFLERNGEGGYMVILQVGDLDAQRARVEATGARIVWESPAAIGQRARAFHLHPADVGGAILSFDWMQNPGDWEWAGPKWQQRARTRSLDGLCGLTIEAPDAATTAHRWGQLTGITPHRTAMEAFELPMDGSTLCIRPRQGSQNATLTAFAVRAPEAADILHRARELELEWGEDWVNCCGCRFELQAA